MKEFTIEQKAKAYDEAIKAAVIAHKDEDKHLKATLERIFPELKESEDEKARKTLIHIVKGACSKYGIKYQGKEIGEEKLLAWLEKQGEHETNEWKEGNIIRHGGILALVIKGRRAIKSNGEMFTIQYPDEWVKAEPNEIECFLKELEKQGKQKQDVNMQINPSEYINDMGGNGCYLKNTTQMPTDKVEPKFKVGDWVVSPNGVYWHIDAIRNNRYQVSASSGECAEWSLDTNIYHRFTIQDAKDGDVLAEDSCIFIIKKMNPNGTAIVHCCLFDDGELDLTGSTLGFDIDSTYPATKEQCDLLFQKMKETGYEWDAEKKELKKIEQKPAEWSEEDEKFFKTALWHISYSISDGKSTDIHSDTTEWFKSLKDRVKSQSQQEWSDEDYNEIETIACHLDNIGNEGMAEVLRNIRDKYYHIIPQTAWKPSDEQIKVCKKVYADILSAKGFDLGTVNSELNRLEEELKELKE